MDADETPKEFPDVNHKLAAPKKLSAFEKARQDEATKRQRAEAENAAALRTFQSSFDDDDNNDYVSRPAGSRSPPTGPRGSGAVLGPPPGRYGIPPSGPRTGPGSLRSEPDPPPLVAKRKRALDELREREEARRDYDAPEPRDHRVPQHRDDRVAIKQDEDHEDEVPKPSIRLSSLPDCLREFEIKDLLSSYVNVHSIQILPITGSTHCSVPARSAIVTLSSETSKAQIETAIAALKDRYLGWGYYLSISRHLSSAVLHPTMSDMATDTTNLPFGAQKPPEPERPSMRNAPPPVDHRGFAPPEYWDDYPSRPAYDVPQQSDTVSIRTPLDIGTIRAVHTVADALLNEPDPVRSYRIEKRLLGRPDVERNEHFSFLFDSTSPAGIYYRFLLWSPEDQGDTTRERKRRARGVERIYDDTFMDWSLSNTQHPFPDLNDLAQVVDDVDYVSSDEESDNEGEDRRATEGLNGELEPDALGKQQLSPLKRAKLIHLLSRLPTSNARLRKGDAARVTNFAITHAGQGAEEIVDLLLLNVDKPLQHSLASKYEDSDLSQDSEDEYEPPTDLPNVDTGTPQPSNKRETDDPSNAKLIALYLVSDILSASSTAGAKNAWKYRQLFESGLKARKTFEHLGRLEKELAWGRLKAEQWKRKVEFVFGIWERWSVFASEVNEELKQSFLEPPMTEAEKAAETEQAAKEEQKQREQNLREKFRKVGQEGSPVDSASPAPAPTSTAAESQDQHEMNGASMTGVDAPSLAQHLENAAVAEGSDGTLTAEDVDGAPMADDIDGAPMADDVDGAPMTEDVDGVPMEEEVEVVSMGLDGATDQLPATDQQPALPGFSMSGTPVVSSAGKPSRPRRMRAEDMFADSDEE